MPFCPNCKAMMKPLAGKGFQCPKCKTVQAAGESRVIATNQPKTDGVLVLEKPVEARPEHVATCPKCGHGRAYFHMMQTRKSDEPPTTFNTCVKCGHTWRQY